VQREPLQVVGWSGRHPGSLCDSRM
jgi:hypothetical protein